MRVETLGKSGQHDCLSRDWARLIRAALGEIRWFPLPNLGNKIESYLEAIGLEALILSGGNSLGQDTNRDNSESSMLDFCRRRNIPVLGVCRGLHMVNFYHAKTLPRKVFAGEHAGHTHPVEAVTELGRRLLAGRSELRSYHEWGLRAEDLAGGFDVWAVAPDGIVEGVIHREYRTIATQWHPERRPEATDAGIAVLRHFFYEL